MTAKRLLTRLAFSLVLVVVVAPWATGETRLVSFSPIRHPNLGGLDVYSYYSPYSYYYPGPIAPYAHGFFPWNGWYGAYYPPLFGLPQFNPAVPGTLLAPGSNYWYYWDNRQQYPPPFYGGYYSPNTNYWWYYRYFNRPWPGSGWHSYRGFRDRQSNSQAPTEVPRNR